MSNRHFNSSDGRNGQFRRETTYEKRPANGRRGEYYEINNDRPREENSRNVSSERNRRTTSRSRSRSRRRSRSRSRSWYSREGNRFRSERRISRSRSRRRSGSGESNDRLGIDRSRKRGSSTSRENDDQSRRPSESARAIQQFQQGRKNFRRTNFQKNNFRRNNIRQQQQFNRMLQRSKENETSNPKSTGKSASPEADANAIIDPPELTSHDQIADEEEFLVIDEICEDEPQGTIDQICDGAASEDVGITPGTVDDAAPALPEVFRSSPEPTYATKNKIPTGYRRLCVMVPKLTDLELKLSNHRKFCKFLATTPRIHLVRISEEVLKTVERRNNDQECSGTMSKSSCDIDSAAITGAETSTSLRPNGTQPKRNLRERKFGRKTTTNAPNTPFLDIPGMPPANALWNFRIKKKALATDSTTSAENRPLEKTSATASKLDPIVENQKPSPTPVLSFPVAYSSPLMRLEAEMAKKPSLNATRLGSGSFRGKGAMQNGRINAKKRAPGQNLRLVDFNGQQSSNQQVMNARRRIPLLGSKPLDVAEDEPDTATERMEKTAASQRRAQSQGRDPSESSESAVGPTTPPPVDRERKRKQLNWRQNGLWRTQNQREKTDSPVPKNATVRRSRMQSGQGRSGSRDTSTAAPSSSYSGKRQSRSPDQHNPQRRRSISPSSYVSGRRWSNGPEEPRQRCQKNDSGHGGRKRQQSTDDSQWPREDTQHLRRERRSRSRSDHSGIRRRSPQDSSIRRSSSSSHTKTDPMSASQSPISDGDELQSQPTTSCDNKELMWAALYLLGSLQQQGTGQDPLQNALLENLANMASNNTVDGSVQCNPVESVDGNLHGNSPVSSSGPVECIPPENVGDQEISVQCVPPENAGDQEISADAVVDLRRVLETLATDVAAARLGLSEVQKARVLALLPLMKELENLSRAHPGAVSAAAFAPIITFVSEVLGVNPLMTGVQQL